MPVKHFGEKRAWEYPNFLDTPYYLRKKSPLKISGIVAVGIVRDSRKF